MMPSAPGSTRHAAGLRRVLSGLLAGLLLGIGQAGAAAEGLRFDGIYALRYEKEWVEDSAIPFAERITAYAKTHVHIELPAGLDAIVGLSTGRRDRHQSSVVTLLPIDNASQAGDRHVYADLWYLERRWAQGSLAGGRMAMPLWSWASRHWDLDATPLGVWGHHHLGSDALSVSAGLWTAPDGTEDFHGRLASAEVLWEQQGAPGRLSLSLLDWSPDDGGEHLGIDGFRDARLLRLSGRVGLRAGSLPVQLGFDLYHNLADVEPLPLEPGGDDARTGLVVGVQLGDANRAGDWRVRLDWLHLEEFSAPKRFANNNLSRLGTTNLKGPDLRIAYGLGQRWWLQLRYAHLERIAGRGTTDRARLELIHHF